jgi:outer membrane protein assembly factor BamE (lipoprotein component of BamABCDE complex)
MNKRMTKPWRVAAALTAAVAGLWLAGCDSQRIAKLEEGVATEEQVRAQFGAPASVQQLPDGSRVLDYPRQPEGHTNYRITIGPDGKMSALRQLLTPANFARVQPGMDKLQVIELLGRTARTQAFALKSEESWEWRFLDGQAQRLFVVTINNEGKVTATAAQDDPRPSQQHPG